jgi:2-polyprenyl-6-hydroxyphenyl methylase/3-demethylubiquinone-9 3-methyltransferase
MQAMTSAGISNFEIHCLGCSPIDEGADIMRNFIAWQLRLSQNFDRRYFESLSRDGNVAYIQFVPTLISDGARIADVGGGKTPFFNAKEVAERSLRVTGVDIDAGELSMAPAGTYAAMLNCALEECRGSNDHDLVIAQSVLEHVRDGAESMRGIASLLRKKGIVATFCPNRRAWFARLNMILPEGVKRKVLFTIFPNKRERQGFPAHYSGCTPSEMARNMRCVGIRPLEVRHFFVSSYFMFFFPLYLFWRIATYPLMRFWPHRYCETFIMIGEYEGK